MSLLGDIGSALRGALEGDVFPAATLHVATPVIGEYGETSHTFVDHACVGFAGDWDARTMAARGYDANTAKVVLVQSDTLPRPKVEDQVTATRPLNGTTARYRITHVTSDPADATYQVAGVLL
jgi:hypothetical protein